MEKTTIREVMLAMEFKLISGGEGLDNVIEMMQITNPGVELAGHFDFFEPKRSIVIGRKEMNIVNSLDEKTLEERVDKMFRHYPPFFAFSKDVEVPEIFIKKGNYFNTPVFQTVKFSKTLLTTKLYSYLVDRLAPKKSLHGVLLDINGIGVLIRGKSGIGKSEIALELIKQGHTLVADDRVEVYEKEPGLIIGKAPKILEQFMEIRGIGVVNVVQMYGVGVWRGSKKLKLIVELESWEDNKVYDRLGLKEEKELIFNTEVTKISIPISSGRSAASVVEAAAMDFKLKFTGYNASQVFTDNLTKMISGDK